MARDHLEKRAEWQGKSAARGQGAEDVFNAIMCGHFREGEFELTLKPKDLRGIYGTRKSTRLRRETPHGIIPEFCIRNPVNGKAVYVEIKRQRTAGNAHERACKYMMPGILAAMRRQANQPSSVIPFWWIFTNGIASDPYYRQEIEFWFAGCERNLLLWRNVRDTESIIEHFESHIRPLLD